MNKLEWIDIKPSKNVQDYLDLIKKIQEKKPIETMLAVPPKAFGINTLGDGQ